MRGGLLGLALLALVAGCDGDDMGVDASMDATTGDDAGPGAAPVCRASSVAGCQEACEFFYQCAVDTSLADRIEQIFEPLGFSGEGFMDCTGCLERCEAGTGNETPLSCFGMHAETSFCADGAGDPTVAANAVNQCCEGQLDSTFCVETCSAVASLDQSIFPNCAPLLTGPQPPVCAGTCPAVTFATPLSVTAEGAWNAHTFAVGPSGEIAVLGLYRDGTIDFGSGVLEAAAGSAATFLAVYDAAGAPKWSARLGDGHTLAANQFGTSFPDGVVFDADGNVAVLTGLVNPVDLGAGTLTSAGGTDVLFASFGGDGALRWAVALGGPGEDLPAEITAEGTDLLFTSLFEADADFGGGVLPNAGEQDIVVARYDTDGVHLWSRAFGGTGVELMFTVAAHPSGDYTVAGGLTDGGDLGAGPIASAGEVDSFVARYAPDGTLRWADVRGASMFDYVYQIASAGERTIVSDFSGSEDMDTTYGTTPSTGVAWVTVSYAEDGTVEWAHPYAAPDRVTIAISMDIDSVGRLAMTGTGGGIDLGGGTLTAIGGGDFLIASFDPSGAHRWSTLMGTLGNDPPPEVQRLATGELAVVGIQSGDIDYGSGVVTTDGRGMFLIRFAAE